VTLRRRVALAAATAIVLAVALLVIAVPKFLENELKGTLEDTLVRRAADVARLNATAPDQLTAPGAQAVAAVPGARPNDQQRLESVAAEVRRRRALRQAAATGTPTSTPPPAPTPAQSTGTRR